HATTSPRTAMAVASGWLGLCTRPFTSRVVGICGTRQNLDRARRRRGPRWRLDIVYVDDLAVDDLAVDVVAAVAGIAAARVGRADRRLGDQRYPPLQPA